MAIKHNYRTWTTRIKFPRLNWAITQVAPLAEFAEQIGWTKQHLQVARTPTNTRHASQDCA